MSDYEKKYGCSCKDCEKERAALQKQLDHPFYKKVDDFRDEIKAETLLKASKKYNEPFNPASWSIEELGKHAMAENYDQGNYIVGLMDAAKAMESRAIALASALETANAQAEYWRLKAVAANKRAEGLQNTMYETRDF